MKVIFFNSMQNGMVIGRRKKYCIDNESILLVKKKAYANLKL